MSVSRQTQASARNTNARSIGMTFKRVRDKYDIPLMLKGIATAEDAEIAVKEGCDVIYVSNHGGRQLDHGRGVSAYCPKSSQAVDGRAKVVLDGGHHARR